MMKSKTRTNVKLAVMTHLLLGSCWGWSCTTDMRDAVWAGAMDYMTGTTTDALTGILSAEDLFPEEE